MNIKVVLSVLVSPLALMAAPEVKKVDFWAVSRAVNAEVEKLARAEASARQKAHQEFVFGLREGGSTFGYGQMPLQIKEAPGVDAKVMAAARAKLRAALPADPLSEADQVRLASACLALEQRGGCQASRAAAFAELARHVKVVSAIRESMTYLKRRNAQVEILALAEKVIAANKNDTKSVQYMLGLGWRWYAATHLADKPLQEATKALVEALPLTEELMQNAYLVALDADRDERSYKRMLDNLETIRSSSVRRVLLTELMRGKGWAGDYKGMKAMLPLALKYADPRAIYPQALGTMMSLRCWKDSVEIARMYLAAYPDSAHAQQCLASSLLACGEREEAFKYAQMLAENGTTDAKTRFAGRVMKLVASLGDPSELAATIRGLEADSGAKDATQFAEFVMNANYQVFAPLMTSENAKWLIAGREALLSLIRPEERVVYTVHYRPAAPRTAGLAEAEGVFDPSWFADWEVERRFAPYQTYSWTQKRAVMANLKCLPERKLEGVTGEGRSAELVAFYDETGVHVYMRFRDPSAAQYRLGEAPGCGFEFTVQHDETKGWNQIFTKTDAVRDLNEVTWDSVEYGHKPTLDMIKTDSTTTEDAFLFHTFIPWVHVYTKLPKDGDTWNTVLCVSIPAGTYVLGGGAVHELGRGMKLKFAMTADEERMVRRATVRKAAGDFLRWRSAWENVAMWKDEVLGDPEFWSKVVAGWLAERERVAKTLVKRPDAEVADGEYEFFATNYLRDWADPRLKLDELRAAWVTESLFRE